MEMEGTHDWMCESELTCSAARVLRAAPGPHVLVPGVLASWVPDVFMRRSQLFPKQGHQYVKPVD